MFVEHARCKSVDVLKGSSTYRLIALVVDVDLGHHSKHVLSGTAESDASLVVRLSLGHLVVTRD